MSRQVEGKRQAAQKAESRQEECSREDTCFYPPCPWGWCVSQKECRCALGKEAERVIELLRLENYSGRLGVCWHMKIIILLQADGELIRDCVVLGTACSSPGQEAKTFIFLGGRGC